MQRYKKLKNVYSLFILSLLVLPAAVFGAVTLENNYPELPGFSPSGDTNLFVYIFNLCVYAAGLVAIGVVIYQGVNILLSKGVVSKVEEAKDRIKAALFGLAILFGSYLLLMAINPELTKINLPVLEYAQKIFTGNNNGTDNTVTYKEIPLGSIIEAILIPNSTSVNQSFNYSQLTKKTEEECYLYDKYGNTIDRNNDGVINGQDVVEGLDMSVCMDNLLNAIIAKIKWFNGNETICNGNIANTAGPINAMKTFIRDKSEGCNQSNCALWPDVSYPASEYPNGCKTIDPYTRTCTDPDDGSTVEVTGTACQSACSCCGGPRGSTAGTGASCQTVPSSPFYLSNNYAPRDPCKSRQKIDCARQEMNFRIYGKGRDDLQGLKCSGIYEYSPDIAPFIDEDNNTLKIIDYTDDEGHTYKAQFLTFTSATDPKGAKERMSSFKNYFDNRIIELQAATSYINFDKTKNVLSLAEFQSLQQASSVAVDTEPLIPDYDPSTYHSFVCKGYDANSKFCVKGGLVNLKSEGYAFLPGENYNNVGTLGEGQKPITDPPAVNSSAYTSDAYADGWPFKAKRIWNNKLASDITLKSDVYNSGDPDTLYILGDAGTTDATKYSEAATSGVISTSPTTAQCTLKDSEKTAAKQIDRGTLTSVIPIGQLADGMADYVTQLDGIITSTVAEIQNTIDSADRIANLLPESCNCSNATNQGLCTGGDTNNPSSSGTTCPPVMGWIPNFSPATCDGPSCPDAPSQTCGTPACSACIANEQDVCDFGCLDCGTTSNIDSAYYACLRDVSFVLQDTEGSLPNICSDAFLSGGQCGVNNFFRNTGCGVTTASGRTDTASIMQSLSNITITGNHCSCSSNAWYLASGDTCREKLFGHPSYHEYGPVCSSSNVASIRQAGSQNSYDSNFQLLNMGAICQCTYSFASGGQCYNPLTNAPLNCNTTQLSSGEFTLDSDCGAIASGLMSSGCLNHANSVTSLGPFWNVLSCNGNTMKIAPSAKFNITTCEESATDLTPEEQQAIQAAQDASTPTLQWSTEDPNVLTYPGLNCCEMYYHVSNGHTKQTVGISNVFNTPSGYTAKCLVNNGVSSIRVDQEMAAGGPTPRPLPARSTQPYYVCPYNDVKKEQSKIYKQVENPSLTNIVNGAYGTNQSCTEDVPGFLQRIEVMQTRLRDYQNGVNLLPGDKNRFTLLDQLNLTRTRFNECVQGFKIENKDAATRTYLFTCEEGLNYQKLGVNKILPQFPPYNSILPETSSTGQWGCYPFNSTKLTADEKLNCQINPGWSGCQLVINRYTPDFYCCLSGQSSTH